MKDKKTLAVGARCRVKDIEQLEGTVVSDTGIVVEESDAAVKVHHDHWPKDEWYLREQCRRLRKKPRPAKEERERVEVRAMAGKRHGCAWQILTPFDSPSDYDEVRGGVLLVELRENEVLVGRAKLEEKWKRVVSSHINFRDQSPDMPVCQALAAALGLPAKGQP